MVSQEVQVQNKIGLHARPASMLVNTAGKFQSEITILKDGRSAAAKSIINLLALRVKQNDSITIRAEGADEEKAVSTLVSLVNSKFGEA